MSYSQRDAESRNIIWPLANSQQMVSQASVQALTTPTFVDLKHLFGKFDTGHAVSVQADGGKIYIALGAVPTASISLTVGTGVKQCWPIPDGVSERYFQPGGREVGTGVGTGSSVATSVSYRYLQYFGSGTLRLYRSSLGLGQTTEEFPMPWGREPVL